MSGSTSQEHMDTVLNNFLDEIYKLKDEEGAVFEKAFHALPLRSNASYFRIIKRPMSYSKIHTSIRHSRYKNVQQFVNDVAQITWNARFFNEEGSIYYKWATILDNYLRKVIIPSLMADKQLKGYDTVTYPNLGNLPNQKKSSAEPELYPESTGKAARSNQFRNQSMADQARRINKTKPLKTPTEDMSIPDFSQAAQPRPSSSPYIQPSHHGSSRHPVLPNYNPAAYTDHIEPGVRPNVYNPPRISNSGISNRSLLEQWVKRGRPPIVDKPHEQRIKSIMRGLKKIKVKGKTIIAVFDKLPSQQDHPEFYRMIKDPVSMLEIKGLIKQRYYHTVDAYMADVFRLIANGKKFYSAIGDSFSLHNIELLETNIIKLYHLEMAKPDSDYIGDLQSSRLPVSQVVYQGRSYKVGNWVMMRNPNDNSRPIPSQIFRIWQEHGKQFLNVCWYYRPEWTTHRFDRLFLDNEAFKTGQYRDHPVEDIVGPCYVAYFTRWLKGDPAVKFEGPLFTCEFRYNDRDMSFTKIRTWKACLPDEVRHIEDPILPLDKPRILRKVASPIKHLLPPGSSPDTPIPPPTILNLNAPPLIGGIYVKRLGVKDEPNYFDATLEQDQVKVLVPPALNSTKSEHSGHRGRSTSMSPRFNDQYSGMTSRSSTQFPPEQPPYLPLGGGLASVPGALQAQQQQQSGVLPDPQIQQSPQSQQVQALMNSMKYSPYGVNGQVQDIHLLNGKTMNIASMGPYTQQLLKFQQQQQQQQMLQQQQFQQQQLQQLQRQEQELYMSRQNTPHSYSGGSGHKIIHTPFNNVNYQFSPYVQASMSQTYLQPSSRERLIPRFARKNYLKADSASFDHFYKTLEKLKYLEQTPGEQMVSPDDLKEEKAAGSTEPDPLLWFKAPPQLIPNRILSSGEPADDLLSNTLNPVLKHRKLNSGVQAIKLGHSAKYLAWKMKKKYEKEEGNAEKESVVA